MPNDTSPNSYIISLLELSSQRGKEEGKFVGKVNYNNPYVLTTQIQLLGTSKTTNFILSLVK